MKEGEEQWKAKSKRVERCDGYIGEMGWGMLTWGNRAKDTNMTDTCMGDDDMEEAWKRLT